MFLLFTSGQIRVYTTSLQKKKKLLRYNWLCVLRTSFMYTGGEPPSFRRVTITKHDTNRPAVPIRQ